MSKKVKVLAVFIPVIIIALILTVMCIERVPAGYVGVQYSVSGGIEDDLLTQGWHLVSPMKKVTLYSIATEQLYMSADSREGSENDDSFDVVCSDGTMNIDLEMSYTFNPDDVVSVFTKYRGLDGDTIVQTIIRGKIKTKVSEVTSKYTVLNAYMEEKSQLNVDITTALREYLADFGITVESANITRASVDASIAAAITERSRVAQELEVEKMNQEKAALQAQTNLITQEGVNAVQISEAEAQAEVYRIKSEAITPELLQKWWIEQWDGKLPTVSSDGSYMLDISGLTN